jgi:hypothetical protein
LPHPPEKAFEPAADLPDPELNPLLNATLGRHLGRWAQVYFTSPPEKREQAVYDLLNELKAEEAAGGPIEEAPSLSEAAAELEEAALVCGHCHHRQARVQNYCGMCGEPLLPGVKAEPRPMAQAAAANMAQTAATSADRPNLDGLLVPGLLFDPHHVAEARGPRSRSMIYADDPPPVTPNSYPEREAESGDAENSADIDWLRERRFLAEVGSESSGTSKVLIVLAVLVLLGSLAYIRFQVLSPNRYPARVATPASQEAASNSSENQAAPAGSTPSAPIRETPDNETAKQASANALSTPSAAAPSSATAAPGPGRVQAPAKHASPPPVTPPNGDAAQQPGSALDNGSAELSMAETYLSGRNGSRNSVAARTLLWKAVGKQNGAALLLLSDLYATGDGGEKSCEQARMLVDIALRKGTPGAANRLRNLSSCR